MWQQDRVMGFLLCSQDIRGKKIPAGHSKVNVTHGVFVCTSQRGKKSSHLFTKRIMAMWPQSVWLR